MATWLFQCSPQQTALDDRFPPRVDARAETRRKRDSNEDEGKQEDKKHAAKTTRIRQEHQTELERVERECQAALARVEAEQRATKDANEQAENGLKDEIAKADEALRETKKHKAKVTTKLQEAAKTAIAAEAMATVARKKVRYEEPLNRVHGAPDRSLSEVETQPKSTLRDHNI